MRESDMHSRLSWQPDEVANLSRRGSSAGPWSEHCRPGAVVAILASQLTQVTGVSSRSSPDISFMVCHVLSMKEENSAVQALDHSGM